MTSKEEKRHICGHCGVDCDKNWDEGNGETCCEKCEYCKGLQRDAADEENYDDSEDDGEWGEDDDDDDPFGDEDD